MRYYTNNKGDVAKYISHDPINETITVFMYADNQVITKDYGEFIAEYHGIPLNEPKNSEK